MASSAATRKRKTRAARFSIATSTTPAAARPSLPRGGDTPPLTIRRVPPQEVGWCRRLRENRVLAPACYAGNRKTSEGSSIRPRSCGCAPPSRARKARLRAGSPARSFSLSPARAPSAETARCRVRRCVPARCRLDGGCGVPGSSFGRRRASGRQLIGVADFEHARVVERPADDLHAERQARLARSRAHDERRVARDVRRREDVRALPEVERAVRVEPRRRAEAAR